MQFRQKKKTADDGRRKFLYTKFPDLSPDLDPKFLRSKYVFVLDIDEDYVVIIIPEDEDSDDGNVGLNSNPTGTEQGEEVYWLVYIPQFWYLVLYFCCYFCFLLWIQKKTKER